jgi:DNA-directed RNA polymerase beta subunit
MQTNGKVRRVRKDFSSIESVIDIPNLIDIQRRSFDRFLQADVEPEKRENVGLQAVFNSIFPIRDFNETASLEFVSYVLEQPKYDVQECLQRGMTYAAPIKVTIRLIVWDSAEGAGHNIRDVKEQEVYFGEIPVMTDNGTFIINGTERVIVSQLHRSPGIFFDVAQSSAVTTAGKKLYSCRIIPYRGSWLDIEFDHKDLIQVRIDRRRKLHATVLLKALGYGPEDLLAFFHQPEIVKIDGRKLLKKPATPEDLIGQRATKAVKTASGTSIVREGRKFTQASVKRLTEAGLEWIPIEVEDLVREDGVKRVAPEDIVDETTGEVILECNEALTEEAFEELKKRNMHEFPLLYLDPITSGTAVHDTLVADKTMTTEEAIIDIYRRLRPGDPPTIETATTVFNNLFFNAERYDLSRVGRLKLNHKLNLDVPIDETTLRRDDIVMAVRYLVDLKNGDPDKRVDDIDHLGNRRVRVVGELLENQYRVGLVRMERAIKERMSLQEIEQLMPHDLINSDEPAFGRDAQAATLGPRAGRADPRAGGFRGSRCARHSLWSDLPGRDAGRSEHRADRVALDLRPSERLRLHRNALSRGRQGKGLGARTLPLGPRRGADRDRAGKRPPSEGPEVRARVRLGQRERRVRDAAEPRDRDDGRVAEPARLSGGLPDSVPRERRRKPGSDGFEHAAAGATAHADGGATRWNRDGGRRRSGLRRYRGCQAKRRDRERGRVTDRDQAGSRAGR